MNWIVLDAVTSLENPRAHACTRVGLAAPEPRRCCYVTSSSYGAKGGVEVLRVFSSSSLIHSWRMGTARAQPGHTPGHTPGTPLAHPRAHPGTPPGTPPAHSRHARASLCFAPEVWQICTQKLLTRRHLRLDGLCVGMFLGEGAFVTMNQSYDSFTRKSEEPLFPHDSLYFRAALHSLLIKKS